MAVLSFLIILSILVLIHELGHFLTAKKLGIKVEEFGFGYPPRIFGIKRRGTIYSLNWLPFGGFVRMLGEDLKNGPDSFAAKGKLIRTAVLTAGVMMNFILGVLLFGAIYTKTGIPEKTDYLKITAVAPGSPAEAAGIKINDRIYGFSGGAEFIDLISRNRGSAISLPIGRESLTQNISLVPRKVSDTPAGEGAIGIGFTEIDYVFYPVWQRPFRGIWTGLQEALAWGKNILTGLGNMVIGLFRGEVPGDVAGPVGIYQISKGVTSQGILATLQFMAILSVNLAILNLLPLPALDGGRLIFILIEALIGRRVKAGLEQRIHLAGMLLLIGLMVLITINDLRRLFG